MKVVINRCFGGFGLSEAAYEQLIAWGVPVRKYEEPVEGEVIFDRELTPEGTDTFNDLYHKYKPNSIGGRYWDTWISYNRTHPLLVRVVEELGAAASGNYSSLAIVEIPDGTDYTIEEYDGREHIAERHQTWV